jgi:hypothetical protein
MTHTKIAALVAGVLLIAGCNPESSDKGGTSQNTPSGTGQGVGAPPADRNAPAPNVTPKEDAVAKPPDNTGRNVRDRSDAAVTPGDQGEAKGDLEVTRQIRQAVSHNDQLSMAAKNVKIISENGKVTLRGPVNSDAEKSQIEQIAKGIAGVSAVDNQLEIKENQQPK